MSYQAETNPHFFWEEQPLREGQPFRLQGFHGDASPEHPRSREEPSGEPIQRRQRARPPVLHEQTPQGQAREGRPNFHDQSPTRVVEEPMSYHPETNPHFWEEQPLRKGQASRPQGFRGETTPEPLQRRQRPRPPVFYEQTPQGQTRESRPSFHDQTPPERTRRGRYGLGPQDPSEKPDQPRPGDQASKTHSQHGSLPNHSRENHPARPHVVPGPPLAKQQQQNKPSYQPHPGGDQHPREERERQGHRSHPQGGFRVPMPRRTRPITWFAAVFCAVFWVVVILGGLIVLIVYLLYRPRSPHFDISTATLNAAYLDMGYLLNGDLRLLANFTNPNKKVSVDFNFIVINLYYESTLIATRSVYPFTTAKMQTMFADFHLITSQVGLKMEQALNLTNEMENNRVHFTVKGIFRVRSNLGGLLRYTYWLYSKCHIVMSRPPDGVLIAKKCKTKR